MSKFEIKRSDRDGEFYVRLITAKEKSWVLTHGVESEKDARDLIADMKMAVSSAGIHVEEPDPDAPVEVADDEVVRPEDDIQVLHDIADALSSQGALENDARNMDDSIKVDWVIDRVGYVVTRAEIDRVLAG